MAQRYELQIGEQNPAGGFIQAPTVNASQIGSSVASIGGALDQWAAFKQKQQDEWDAATVMNAQTEFQKQINDWLYNPETGQTITRKLGNSKDLTQDTNDYADKLIKDITGKLENNNQRIAFQNSVGKLKLPYWEQASRFEARETQQHKDNAYKSGVQTIFETSLSNPDSDAARAIAAEQFESLTRAHLDGADEATIQNTILELQSNLDSALILRIARDDPVRAFEILNNPESGMVLKNETREKLLTNIKPKAEVYEIQGLVDELVDKYGVDNKQDVFKIIHQNYSGEKEDKIASVYRTRIRELKDKNDAKTLTETQRKRANRDAYVKDYALNGTLPSELEIDRALANDEITPQAALDLKNLIKKSQTRAGVIKQDFGLPANADLTLEQEAHVMRSMGVTQEEHESAFSYLARGIAVGDVTEQQIDEMYTRGLITKSEHKQFKNSNKIFSKEQKDFQKQQIKELERDIGNINISRTPHKVAEFKRIAKDYFGRHVQGLDPKSPTYRKEVMQLRREALVYAVGESGKALTGREILSPSTWFGDPVQTDFGRRVEAVYAGIDREINNVQEYRPNVKMDKVDLNAKETNTNWVSALVKGSTITSGVNDTRSRGKHNGIDLAATEGTPIIWQEMGFDLKVAHVETENATKGLGNHVKLTGGYFDNSGKYRSVEITLGHLQKGSIKVKVGDVLKAGAVIAGVGNTGYTGNKKQGFSNWYEGKKHGVHLDLKMKVDGEYVDPTTFKFDIKKQETKKGNQEKGQERPSISDIFAISDDVYSGDAISADNRI